AYFTMIAPQGDIHWHIAHEDWGGPVFSTWVDYSRPFTAPLRIRETRDRYDSHYLAIDDMQAGALGGKIRECETLVAGPDRDVDEPVVLGQFGMEIRTLVASGETLTSETLVVYKGSPISL